MTVRILQGDCLEVLQTLPDASVDAVITDPPYGETALKWDRWPTGWLKELPRLLRPSASVWVFGTMRMFMEQAAEFKDWKIAQEVIWEKHNGSGLHADRFRRVHESIVQFYYSSQRWADVHKKPLFSDDAMAKTVRRKTKPQHWGAVGPQSFYESHDGGPRMLRSVWCCRSEHGRAEHPTQKPIDIILPLIEYSCPSGGVILDPFIGSGTTALAAQRSGRDCLGIELNPKYIAIAQRRLADDAGMFFQEPAA